MCNVVVVQSLSRVPPFATPEIGVTSFLLLTPRSLWRWPGHAQGPLYVMYSSVNYIYRIVHCIMSTYLIIENLYFLTAAAAAKSCQFCSDSV